MTSAISNAPVILVDGHVHLHANYPLDLFFEAAYRNFQQAGKARGGESSLVGVLCLTESQPEEAFQRLYELSNSPKAARQELQNWGIHKTAESLSLILRSDAGRRLILVAGRQISTHEGLEVLALGTRRRLAGGRLLAETLREVAEAEALPVIPWGFGKWQGRRAAVLRKLLEDSHRPQFFLGDNGNRLAGNTTPALLLEAEELGIPNLPGSDPLPFRREYRRVGSAGAMLPGALNPRTPWVDLRKLLLSPAEPLLAYRQGETLRRFLLHQVAMQYRKRRKNRK